MTLPELRACLKSLGVKLSLSGDKLVVDAPVGVITPEVRTALVDHKPALLALLACGPPPAPLSTVHWGRLSDDELNAISRVIWDGRSLTESIGKPTQTDKGDRASVPLVQPSLDRLGQREGSP